MAKVTDIKVKVAYQRGVCAAGHKEGDEWIVGSKTPSGICNAAYISIYPYVRVLQRGGKNKHHLGPEITRVACPDAWNPIVFELSQVPEGSRESPIHDYPETCGHLEHLPYKKDYP